MKVAIIGNGGREHCIGYRIKSSPDCDRLYFIKGNGGTKSIGENIDIDEGKSDEVVKFCLENEVEFVIIGPEKPLVEGLADLLRNAGITVFGPSGNAARIESEKSYAKMIMKKYGVPTANYREFTRSGKSEAIDYLRAIPHPIVIKADGLAAGKGVIICKRFEESESAIKEIFEDNIFGKSGDRIVVEEFLEGEEATIFAITDGERYITLPAAQDHKRIGDGDTGKNTGGMGAYAPAPIITANLLEEIKSRIIEPTLDGLRKEKNSFSGCLYCGLMITKEGPKVIEYNCRFGDPETQVVLPIIEGDLLKLLYSCATGKIDENTVWYGGKSAVCVVAASKGYPENFERGFEISGLEKLNTDQYYVFHSGTKFEGDKLITNGGRVLGLTALLKENNIARGIELAYKGMGEISFKNIYYRNDIAQKALK
ncbi:MAG TPA: phosphoribosylamine--glycine ligase [Ignavibacteriaceae bacterium]|jgi:phosphoribosylamine--glycine ligase|nr:phosphoribosylamine--glycine ligase [Ignavibacteriaceae bacterium]HOJ17766.1 phosphoribosylamine--glycine ligase [Ignavibacteriaceae bacterium]